MPINRNTAFSCAFVILRNEASQRVVNGDASFLSMTKTSVTDKTYQ